jgi:phage terminase large subunit-like protein
MLKNKYVDDYIQKWRDGKIILNDKRVQLIEWLEKEILSRDDLYYFDEERIEDYFDFTEQWHFKLDDWEKFIAPFIFMFRLDNGFVVFRIFLLILGRGAGKNGFISTLAHYFVSSLHGVDNYDVSIVANSEDQAKRSFNDVFNTIIKEHKLSAINTRDTIFDEDPIGEFEPWKSKIISQETQSQLLYHTSNARTKDGGREGAVIFDEFHEYENSKLVKVFTGGLGKVEYPRQFFIGTKGFIREGYFDMMYDRATNILNGDADFNGIFPFICELDDISEMDDEELWEKANPALQKPLTRRGEMLLQTIRDEYLDLVAEPSGRPEFVTKRMNVVEGDSEHSVASRDEIMATDRPFPETSTIPIGGLDFAGVRDFAAVGALFVEGDNEYVWKTHSYALKSFVDKYYGYSNTSNSSLGAGIRAPIKAWEEKGLMTVADEPTIDPRYIVNWFLEAREKWGLSIIVIDNFQSRLIVNLLEDEGFTVIRIRSVKSIEPMVAPQIEDGFANKKIVFGDNPLMRWYTNNVYVKETAKGKVFEKKEKTRRKTDGFSALVHALFGTESEEFKEQHGANNAFILNEIDF